jgi:endonuclease III
MFYIVAVQQQLAFARPDLDRWRSRLGSVPVPARAERRTPVGQLVKSLISARTRDAVSIAAYRRLGARFGSAAGLARADPRAVERAIADVTFADAKADQLVAALRMVEASDGGFALGHLATRPLDDALAWLERLPGVARKVSASTLNASTLGRPVMIVDTHVLRVLARLGLVRERADYRQASEAVTGGAPHWSGDDFLAFHIALKRLGQTVCRWNVPACGACPLAADCATAERQCGGVSRAGQ